MYSDIEIVDEIIESGCGTNIVAAWERIKKKLAEALKPSHNSDYAAALRVIDEFVGKPTDEFSKNIQDFITYCQRLNAEVPHSV